MDTKGVKILLAEFLVALSGTYQKSLKLAFTVLLFSVYIFYTTDPSKQRMRLNKNRDSCQHLSFLHYISKREMLAVLRLGLTLFYVTFSWMRCL